MPWQCSLLLFGTRMPLVPFSVFGRLISSSAARAPPRPGNSFAAFASGHFPSFVWSESAMATAATEPLLLKPTQAAETLGISTRQLWRLKASGAIPHVRIGRAVRFRPETLRRWLASQEQGGKA